MAIGYYENAEHTVKHWWLSVLIGIVVLAIGIIILVNPIESYFAMAIWFGAAVLFSGIFSLAESLTSCSRYVCSGWVILAALCDIVIGIVLLLNFLLSAVAIPYIFGAWLLYRGVVTFGQAIALRRKVVRQAGWVITFSVLVIALSLAVLIVPDVIGIAAVVIFDAFALMAYGLSRILLGFKFSEVGDKE